MGKVDYFIVEFYGGKRTFYPGEAINGTLRLKVNKELKLRGIRLEFHGKASIHWSESTGSGDNRRTRHYSNSETYIDTLATLFGKGLFIMLFNYTDSIADKHHDSLFCTQMLARSFSFIIFRHFPHSLMSKSFWYYHCYYLFQLSSSVREILD